MKLPFFDELDEAQNILIAGAGGGFDVFGGLPLYFWLKKDRQERAFSQLVFRSARLL